MTNWQTIKGETPQEKLAAAAAMLKLEEKPLVWTRRPVVGIAWDAAGGEFSICASRDHKGPVLCLQRWGFLEGCYPTLEKAQAAAEVARKQTTVVIRAQAASR